MGFEILSLADVRDARLRLGCGKCPRRGDYSVARLKARYGDMRLTELRETLAKDCTRAIARQYLDWCGARFERD